MKNKHYTAKKTVLIYDINTDKIVVSNRIPFDKKGFKYYVGYDSDYEKVILLFMMPPKTSTYNGDFDKTNYVFFDER